MFRKSKHWLIVINFFVILGIGGIASGQESEIPLDASTEPTLESPQPPATEPQTTQEADIRLNSNQMSVQALLEYISETAGLVIVDGISVEGRVTVVSRQALTTEEAIALLDTVLKEKGYTAIRTERNLKIVPLEEAAKENLPVYLGNDPSKIPITDKLVTQVIPIGSADATKLTTDLAPLLSSHATLSANAASNTLILVDTQANVRRIVQIIQALDQHMASVSEIRVFQLQYANATNTAKLITELFKPEGDQATQAQIPAFLRGRFGGRAGRQGGGEAEAQNGQEGSRLAKVIATADDRTNTVVVSAAPEALEIIADIIKQLDSNPSAEQAVFLYPLKNARAANLEEVLNNIFSETPTTTGGTTAAQRTRQQRLAAQATTTASTSDLVGQVQIVADEDTNSLLVRTATKHFERVKEIIAGLDRPIPQVLIKVLIAEVTHDNMLDLGTEFSVLNLGLGIDGTFNLRGGTAATGRTMVTATVNSSLSAVFNALQQAGKVDVLSRPYILASDNQQAIIDVGQDAPRVTQQRTLETGQSLVDFEYIPVGINLSVTPHINPDGLVIMDVLPRISSISDTTVVLSETLSGTVYNTRSAQTRVAVSDGQTIVIGGLMQDRLEDNVRKVPGLGDIPLLGGLFRRTTQNKVKTELLIFLTPQVAKGPEDLQKISDAEKAGNRIVPNAVEKGAFEKHMEAMQRGTISQPAGEKDEPPK